MSNATSNLQVRHCGEGGRRAQGSVEAATHIYKGTGISASASGDLVPTTTASSGHCYGVASMECDNTSGGGGTATDNAKQCWYETDRVFLFSNDGSNPFAEGTQEPGAFAFATDDHTVATTGTIVMGQYRGVDSDGLVRVYVSPTIKALADQADDIAALP